jgi:predicted ATPase
MRQVDIAKLWAELYSTNYVNRLASVTLTNVPPIGTTEIRFDGGVTAICGANGVGKSTLLRVIGGLLRQEVAPISDTQSIQRQGGTAGAKYFIKDTEYTLTYNGNNASATPDLPNDVAISSADAMSVFAHQIQLRANSTNLAELLESLTPAVADEFELERLHYILAKNYTHVETYEIVEYSSVDDPIPFFKVTCNGVDYDSTSMGLGELSVHVVLWQLRRAETMSVLLFEEPEAFVAPFSQEALLNVVAFESKRRKLWTIFTTHSPNILGHIPLEHIRLVSHVGAQALVVTPATRSMLKTALRVAVPLAGVIFVEDNAAKSMLRLIIEHFTFQFAREFEIGVAGSDSSVRTLLATIPKDLRGLSVIGVLDGDQSRVAFEANWPCLFLPSVEPPEKILREAVRKNPAALAGKLGMEGVVVHAALAGVEHVEHHDWPWELSKLLGLSIEQVYMACFACWVAEPANAEVCEKLVGELHRAAMGELHGGAPADVDPKKRPPVGEAAPER